MPHTPKLIRFILGAALAAALSQAIPSDATASSPREVKRLVVKLAADTAVPPSMALAVANVESGFRDDFESATGTRGVMQLTPEIARKHGIDPQELWDARVNIELGLKMLSAHFQDAGHEWPVALRRYAKAKPGGYEPGPFARKVLRLERRFAEEMVTRKALENRKREVLNVAMDGQYYFGSGDEADRETAPGEKPQAAIVLADATPVAKQPSSIRARNGLGSELERRRQIARRNLDDFSAGNIPADMLQPRSSRWSRR
jgi:hypothetical protein